MDIPVKKWYEAVKGRHSSRQYDGKAVSGELLAYLAGFAEKISNSLAGVRVVLVTDKPDQVFKGVIGSYGKITGAPAYAAFIGDTTDPHVQEKLGYGGQSFILEACSLGLGTCWVAGFFKPEVVKSQVPLRAGEKVLAVTPVGYAAAENTLDKRAMKSFVQSHKRKNLDALCRGLPQSEWADWIKNALNAARLAPSAINRQPWRFLVENDAITVLTEKSLFEFGVSKRLDCGIAMLHIEIGALSSGVQGQWEYLDAPGVARFSPLFPG